MYVWVWFSSWRKLMSLDVCAFQCQRSARSKCRHPELKMTFLKQLVNSDCQSFLNLFFFFFLVFSKRQDRSRSFWQRVIPGWDRLWQPSWRLVGKAFIGNHCAYSLLLLEIYRAANLQKEKKKKANSLLQGSSSLAQKRQNKRSKVTQKHEE